MVAEESISEEVNVACIQAARVAAGRQLCKLLAKPVADRWGNVPPANVCVLGFATEAV